MQCKHIQKMEEAGCSTNSSANTSIDLEGSIIDVSLSDIEVQALDDITNIPTNNILSTNIILQWSSEEQVDQTQENDDENNHPSETTKPKKRKILGRKSEKVSKLKLASHVMGPSCQCRRACFHKINEETRNELLHKFKL